ncbi:MAG: thiamine ABC transporter substrate-binding protein [Anaerolineales bacterium]|nr:thiamine ABC transporter substrate-binding protein [Anaerolineales bacterium]
MKKLTLIGCVILSFMFAACAPAAPAELVVMTHSSFAVSEAVIRTFETQNNVKVSFVQGGDAGETLNKAILSKDAPLADVLFGVDNTFLSRAVEAGIFETYASPELANVDSIYQLDSTHQLTPIDFGDVCINYDKSYFAQHKLALPNSLESLTQPEYKNLLAVENPATSSVGLAFLLATRAHFGEGYLDYWRELKENGVVVTDGWETAYYTNFSGSSGHGAQPLVVSYASSPAAEVIFAEPPLTDAPTASILEAGTCFRQIEFAGVLKGATNPKLAEKFIDFLLSAEFQNDLPLQMFVYPVNQKATLPEAFVKYSQIPAQPAELTPAEISANRDAWIEAWTEAMQ